MHMKRSVSLLLATVFAVGLAAAADAKTLVYCSEGSPEGFDPGLYTAGTTMDASSQAVYNRLVEFVKGTTNVGPGLAESWDVSADGLEYTFHLRRGVKFHTTSFFTPTRDFNADDVVFTFDRQSNKANPYFTYSGATWEYFNGMSMPDLLKSVTKIDDYNVKFTLTRPNAPMVANLAMDFASIVSKEYADKLTAANKKDQLNQQPIGTGPFQFVEYVKDATIRYAANPTYFRGKQKIDDLVFAITVDPAVRWQRVKAGECNLMSYPNPADLAAIKADGNVTTLQQEGLNVGYLAYNTMQKPFDNPVVRRALNMAVNKQAIIDAVFQGTGKVAKNPIPPTMWSYNDAIKDDTYDPAAAKKMLTDAGITDLKMKLWAMPVSRPYNPNGRRMAELLQADYAKVGVTAEIVTYEWGEYLKRAADKARDGAVELGWTGDNGDPDNFLAVLLGCDAVGGSNRANWCNQEFDQLIQKAATTTNADDRSALYQKAQTIFKDQAPWLTIAHTVVSVPVQKKVTGFKIDPLGHFNFEGVDIAG
jgi:dipeptide transport system substrate-binding protein